MLNTQFIVKPTEGFLRYPKVHKVMSLIIHFNKDNAMLAINGPFSCRALFVLLSKRSI